MRSDPPDTHFFEDIRELNGAFLDLLCHPGAAEAGWRLLGLDPGVAAGLAALTESQRRFAAGVEGLLAECVALPATASVADQPRPVADTAWMEAAGLFTAALLTYLRTLARQDPLRSALCLGPDPALRRRLAATGLQDIQAAAISAAAGLRARYARHPRLWPQLLLAARREDRPLLELCRLELIAAALPAPAAVQGRRRALR